MYPVLVYYTWYQNPLLKQKCSSNEILNNGTRSKRSEILKNAKSV